MDGKALGCGYPIHAGIEARMIKHTFSRPPVGGCKEPLEKTIPSKLGPISRFLEVKVAPPFVYSVLNAN